MCDSRVGISRDAMSASLALLVGSAGSGIPNTTGGRGTYARESPADKKEEQIQKLFLFSIFAILARPAEVAQFGWRYYLLSGHSFQLLVVQATPSTEVIRYYCLQRRRVPNFAVMMMKGFCGENNTNA